MSAKRQPDPRPDDLPTELELVIRGLLSLLRRRVRVRYWTDTYPGGRIQLHLEYVEPDLAAVQRRAS